MDFYLVLSVTIALVNTFVPAYLQVDASVDQELSEEFILEWIAVLTPIPGTAAVIATLNAILLGAPVPVSDGCECDFNSLMVQSWDNLKTIAIVLNTHNYNDVDFDTISGWRIGLLLNLDLTGIVNVTGGTQAKFVFNNAMGGLTPTLTLRHENGSSAAANRFYLPNEANLTLRVGEGVMLIYETIRNRWVVMGTRN